ncbi:MAG: fimbrillin family protein [Bacteroidaceae bacterium]|nr:fimbrillin family protein [Bacteroidaceae bacterium]
MKIYHLIISLVFLFALTACNNQNENIPIDKEVVLEITLKEGTSRNIIEGSVLPDESQMGVFVVDSDENIMESNVLVNYVDKVCQMTEPVYLSKEDMNVYAYYPYDKSASLKKIQVNAKNQIDYLYGYAVNDNDVKTTVNIDQPHANILLKHIMSRITFNIEKVDEIETELYFTDIMVEGFNGSGTFDIQKGEFLSMEKIGFSLKFPAESKSVDFLTMPTDNVQSVYLNIGINNKSYAVKLPEGAWESGQQYTYTIIVEKGNVSIGTIEITPWNENIKNGIEINDNNYIEN